jgi:hypothetical protein
VGVGTEVEGSICAVELEAEDVQVRKSVSLLDVTVPCVRALEVDEKFQVLLFRRCLHSVEKLGLDRSYRGERDERLLDGLGDRLPSVWIGRDGQFRTCQTDAS